MKLQASSLLLRSYFFPSPLFSLAPFLARSLAPYSYTVFSHVDLPFTRLKRVAAYSFLSLLLAN